jgi:hypothetical protein
MGRWYTDEQGRWAYDANGTEPRTHLPVEPVEARPRPGDIGDWIDPNAPDPTPDEVRDRNDPNYVDPWLGTR